MFKVKRGNIEAVCYTQKDVDNYIQAGWKLVNNTISLKKVEEPKVEEETIVEETIEEPEEKEITTEKKNNKYSSLKIKK